MLDNILNGVKDALGVGLDNPAFDNELLLHINTAFAVLTNIGVGKTIRIDSSTTWDEFENNEEALALIQSYVVVKVRKFFDPPGSSSYMEALNSAISEYEWRLQVMCDPYTIETDERYTAK